jgi:hypothetical protein
MIPLNFGLWWSGCKLSYLRYLTFKSLRHFHPDSKIELFVGTEFKNNEYKWGSEKQDFEDPDAIEKDYMGELEELDVEVRKVNWFSQYASNFQSDLFRWWYLNNYGGFYLDTDQIILKSFSGLSLNHNFIYSGYAADSCGYYTPVGVIGATKDSQVVDYVFKNLISYIDVNNYNSAGPFMLRTVMTKMKWTDKIFNAPSSYFYPIDDSYKVDEIYSGKLIAPRESFALHWYGGHPKSQEFNKKYDEFFAKNSTDTISCLLKERGIA